MKFSITLMEDTRFCPFIIGFTLEIREFGGITVYGWMCWSAKRL
jgi:hypothetical protein